MYCAVTNYHYLVLKALESLLVVYFETVHREWLISLAWYVLVALPHDGQLLYSFNRVALEHADLPWVLSYVGATIAMVTFIHTEVLGRTKVELTLIGCCPRFGAYQLPALVLVG